jgi:hypothetical protein
MQAHTAFAFTTGAQLQPRKLPAHHLHQVRGTHDHIYESRMHHLTCQDWHFMANICDFHPLAIRLTSSLMMSHAFVGNCFSPRVLILF